MKTSEAQKRASEKYRLKHMEYYSQKSKEYQARIRQERNEYKQRINKAIELLKKAGCYDEETQMFCDDVWDELPDLLNILEGKYGIVD